MKNIIRILTISIVIIFLSSCADKPTSLELIVRSTNDLNKNKENEASPVFLYFYELKDAEIYTKADFWDLIEQPNKIIGDNLIASVRHIHKPDENQSYKILCDEKTQFLGVIGKFRVIERDSKWKYIYKVVPKEHNTIELSIDKYAINEVIKEKK